MLNIPENRLIQMQDDFMNSQYLVYRTMDMWRNYYTQSALLITCLCIYFYPATTVRYFDASLRTMPHRKLPF